MKNSIFKNLALTCTIIILFSASSRAQEEDIEKKKMLESPETIDLSKSWRFSPDGKNIGMSEKWYALNFDDSQWDIIDAGKRWEDQGYPELDDCAWYRKVINIPSGWEGRSTWLKFTGVNDSYTLFVNGERIKAFNIGAVASVGLFPTYAAVDDFLKYGGPNLITLKVNDVGGGGGLQRSPIIITTDKNQIPDGNYINSFIIYEKNELLLSTNIAYFGKDYTDAKLIIKIENENNAKCVETKELELTKDSGTLFTKISMPQAMEKTTYTLTEEVKNHQGEIIVSLSKKIEWNPPYLQPDKNGIKQLNNFVSELFNKKISSDDTSSKFFNPKNGWVFISVESSINNSKLPEAKLDQNPKSIIFRVNHKTGANEAMQFLSKGKHTLNLKHTLNSQVIIRSIPELIYSAHPSSPKITPYGSYDWNYLAKHVLSHVNTIRADINSMTDTESKQWKKEGRNFIVGAHLPGNAAPLPESAEEVCKEWSKSPGSTNPYSSGIIVDEFLPGSSAEHYLLWADALSLLYKDPVFSNKKFYAYCGKNFEGPKANSIPFGKKLVKLGGVFAFECYLVEPPTEEEAYSYLLEELSHTYKNMRKNLGNGEQNWIINFGYFTVPSLSLNTNPSTDYRVFMDMKFHLLANDPIFSDLYGIKEWTSSYADEELVRWVNQLYRHYCIEGKRTRLTDDPYVLPHLRNPDFADGFKGWTIESAEEKSIQPKSMTNYGYLQGRWASHLQGDQFISFKRSAKQPNTIRQKVKQLDPTRLYSLKLIASDLQHLNKEQKLSLSIKLDQVEIIDDFTFQFIVPGNKVNFYRIVFRPKSETAELTISDWSNSLQLNGPVDQEIIFNFIEIQPFNAKLEQK